MRENRLRRLWAENQAAVNGWLAVPASFSAEVMAQAGFDSLTIDMQHGVVEYQTAVTMLQAISTTATVPAVRVPWLDPGIIMKMLDAGAYAVICPMVSTAEQARLFASALRYPPRGERSFGPIRGLLYGGPDYAQAADDTILGLAMIETREALDQLDAICTTPGIDAVYIGPADLSLALGRTPRFDQDDPVVLEAIGHILKTAKRHGLRAGIHNGTAEYAKRMIALGFDLVTIGSDARFMAAQAQAVVAAMKDRPQPGSGGGY